MTDSRDPLTDANVAAAVAPIIDRLRLGIATRVRAGAMELAVAAGIGMEGGRTFAMLRNSYPSRRIVIDDLRAVFTYMPADAVQAGIDELVTAGLVDVDDRTLVLSSAGAELMARFVTLSADEADALWGASPLTQRMCELTSRAFDAAKATGGPTFGVVSPLDQPPDGSAASRLAELLTALRFHRYDCHVSAWREAGLTAPEMAALSDGPQRDAIEATTNRGAAAPYAVLTDGERFELVPGLGSLPS